MCHVIVRFVGVLGLNTSPFIVLKVAIDGNNGDSFIEIPKNEKYEIYKVDTADEQGIFKTY